MIRWLNIYFYYWLLSQSIHNNSFGDLIYGKGQILKKVNHNFIDLLQAAKIKPQRQSIYESECISFSWDLVEALKKEKGRCKDIFFWFKVLLLQIFSRNVADP